MPSETNLSAVAATDRSGFPALIGIDVGSTSIRAIAFDLYGRRISVGTRPTPMRRMDSGGEYDPDAIFDASLGALADLGKALAGRPVAGIAATSIGESCVLVDGAGRSVAPSIAWYDRRALPQARAIEERCGREGIFRITGHAVEPIFTLPKLVWMRAHWPEAIEKARRVLMIADWIAFRLSGVAATDAMLASRTLYFDIRRWCWSEELLAIAGFDTDFPARLVASGAALGPVRRDILAATGLAGSPIVAVGGHDHVLGALASGLANPGTLIDSIGTAEGLYAARAEPLDGLETIRRGYVQGAIETDRRRCYVGGSIFSAGGALDWFRSVVGEISQTTLIAEASQIPAGSRGVVFLPHLANSPPPEPDEYGRGAFLGLTPAVTPPMLYRAILEGLAMQARMLADGIGNLIGADRFEHIRLIGGVSRNSLFVSIKANVFGRPIVVNQEPETTALGAALLAGVGAGVFPAFDAALDNLERQDFVVEPDASVARYAELRARVFEGIHERIRPINRNLDALGLSGDRSPH